MTTTYKRIHVTFEVDVPEDPVYWDWTTIRRSIGSGRGVLVAVEASGGRSGGSGA